MARPVRTEPSCHLDSEKAAMDEEIVQVGLHGDYKHQLAWKPGLVSQCIEQNRIDIK